MNAWSHGYNVSQGYTFGFYRELAPAWLDAAAQLNGFQPGRASLGASFRYLELGSGQGVGLCLLAAANPSGEFVGVDFHPEHIAHARELAAAAGLANVRFVEADFVSLADNWPADLGEFDYVVMHGIYSWIPEAVRASLVRCLAHATYPGALVYLSYNALPGWASTIPFQHLARRLQLAAPKPGPQVIAETISLFDTLEANRATIMKALPALKSRIESARTQNPAYLVQEYLHDSWTPMWFSQVASELAGAKLSYLGSVTYSELLLPATLPQPLRDLILSQADPTLREEIQDCAINQAFRRDLFGRGVRAPLQANGSISSSEKLHLLIPAEGEDLRIKTAYGELGLKQAVFGPLMEALAGGAMTMAELVRVPALKALPPGHARQAVTLLLHSGHLTVGPPAVPDAAPAQALNRAMARLAAAGGPYTYLAVPAFGGAVNVRDIDLLMLDVLHEEGAQGASDLAQGLLRRLDVVGRKLSREGKALDGKAALNRAADLAKEFLETAVPKWRNWGALAE